MSAIFVLSESISLSHFNFIWKQLTQKNILDSKSADLKNILEKKARYLKKCDRGRTDTAFYLYWCDQNPVFIISSPSDDIFLKDDNINRFDIWVIFSVYDCAFLFLTCLHSVSRVSPSRCHSPSHLHSSCRQWPGLAGSCGGRWCSYEPCPGACKTVTSPSNLS